MIYPDKLKAVRVRRFRLQNKMSMGKTTVHIYTGNGMYYGNIRIDTTPRPFTLSEEELVGEIKARLPLLKNKKFTIQL